jgi:hypothetical protein
MNSELSGVIKAYATKPHKELNAILLDKSKDSLIAILNSMLTLYMNDKNSSTLREFITVSIAGYEQKETKLGYNGYKQSTKVGGKPIACEVKPRNIDTESNGKRKHNGGGNFTDYTPARFGKDLRENPNLLVSGFVNGQLIFIIQFPFKCPPFVKNLKEKLKKRFSGRGKSGPGQYLRSAQFTYKDYEDYDGLKLVYLNKDSLASNKNQFSKGFYDFLVNFRKSK